MLTKKLLPLCFLSALFSVKGAEDTDNVAHIFTGIDEGLKRVTEICEEQVPPGVSFKQSYKADFAEAKRSACPQDKKTLANLEAKISFDATALESELKDSHQRATEILTIVNFLTGRYDELHTAYTTQGKDLEASKKI